MLNVLARFGVVSGLGRGGFEWSGVVGAGSPVAHLYRLDKGTKPALVPVLVKCVARMKRYCQGSFIGGESRAERRKRTGGGWKRHVHLKMLAEGLGPQQVRAASPPREATV